MAPGPYKQTESDRSRVNRRSNPSALVSDGDRRQRQADTPPAPSRPDPSAVRSDKIFGDKAIGARWRF